MAAAWSDERSAAGKRNPWLIIGIISMATFMEVLDTSIANVSLSHIAGGLSSSQDEATWVLTSYLIANAIVIPISGWLSETIGRKRYYMISVALFTVASLCCGLAPNLGMLILARIFQGIGGGGLAPSEQSIVVDTFPPEKRGQAFAAYAIVVVVGPVLGPTLGGFITDNMSWHWIFLINVPVGALSLTLVQTFVCEPKALVEERLARRREGLNVDYIGFLLVALGLGGLEFMLDRGERDDWFASPLIVSAGIVSILSLALLVPWELFRKRPIVNVRLLGNRNFAVTIMFMATTGLVLFGTTTLIPQMLQQVFDYTATDAGLALTVGGVATLVAMPVAGSVAGKVDTRVLMVPALLIQAFALWVMTGWSTDISFHQASMGRLISAVGLPFLFIPISTVAYVGLKPEETNDATALLNVFRNLGGSFGIAVAQAQLIQRGQYNQSRITEGLNPLNPNYTQGLDQIGQMIGGMASSAEAGAGQVYQLVLKQAQMLAYIDVFHQLMLLVLVITPFGFLIQSGKGGGEGAPH